MVAMVKITSNTSFLLMIWSDKDNSGNAMVAMVKITTVTIDLNCFTIIHEIFQFRMLQLLTLLPMVHFHIFYHGYQQFTVKFYQCFTAHLLWQCRVLPWHKGNLSYVHTWHTFCNLSPSHKPLLRKEIRGFAQSKNTKRWFLSSCCLKLSEIFGYFSCSS